MSAENKSRKISLGILQAAILVAADQLTKHLARQKLLLSGRGSIELIPGVLSLHYLENRGAAFGMLQNRAPVFAIFAVLVILAACFFYGKIPSGRRFLPMRIAVIGLMGGAAGNLIDRIFRGYVIDFIYFSLIDFPVFNVADICVSLSVVLLLVLILFFYRERDFEWLSFPKKNKD